MDYSYCNIMFTEGQKTRMRAALNSSMAGRNNLWTPANLIATGVTPESGLCAANFESDKKLVCAHIDNAITFSNTSYHGETDSLLWNFPGGFPPTSTQANPTIAYSESGMYDVSLTVYSNGESQQLTSPNYVTVLQDSSWSYPFWEWFEGNGNLLGSPWFENSLDTDNNWEISDLAGHSTSHSIMVDNWEKNTITVDELYAPPINLATASSMRIGFWFAFSSQSATTNNSKLQVQISRNCESNWSTRLTINGSQLETAAIQTTPFTPNHNQWVQGSINIPSSYFEDGFRFRFKFTSEGNNRIFLDDINVDVTADIHDTFSSFGEALLFPNPGSEQLTVSFYLKKSEEVSFTILDEIGKSQLLRKTDTYSAGKNQSRLDIEKLTPGVYLLQLETQRSVELKRFIKL
jgi:PKD repeat protein